MVACSGGASRPAGGWGDGRGEKSALVPLADPHPSIRHAPPGFTASPALQPSIGRAVGRAIPGRFFSDLKSTFSVIIEILDLLLESR